MGWRRHSGAVVSLALLASVVGHYAIHRHFEVRFQRLVSDSRLDADFRPGLPLMPLDDEEPSSVPRFLDQIDRPQRFQQILPALQIRQDGDNDDVSSKSPRPQPVPDPREATPLTETHKPSDAAPEKPSEIADDNAVRRVIDEELLGSSREERDIWYDELKSIPAGVVRDRARRSTRPRMAMRRRLPERNPGTRPVLLHRGRHAMPPHRQGSAESCDRP